MRMRGFIFVALPIAVLGAGFACVSAAAEATAAPAVAAAVAATPPAVNSGDTAWLLASAALVMLMTPGLAFFYGGLVRRKNVLSVLMQCMTILCIVTLQWVVLGYSLSFGPDIGGITGDLSWAGLKLSLIHI